MSELIKIIYLNLYEDITSVVDRLERIEQDDIILFIPYDSYLSQNVTNFKILKREEAHLNKNIIIVSPDIVVREFARTVGLAVFEEIDDVYAALKEKGLKRKVTTRVFDIIGPSKTEILEKETEEPKLGESISESVGLSESYESPTDEKLDYFSDFYKKEPPKSEKFKEYQKLGLLNLPNESESLSQRLKKILLSSRQFSINKILIGIMAISVLVGFISIYLFLEEADVKIYPTKEIINLNLKITANKGISKINVDKLEIPSQLIVVEKNGSDEFFATGKKFAKEKARGVITIYNAYSSSYQVLVQNTRFLSQDGKLFRTTKKIVVPGAKVEDGKLVPSSIDVEVIADDIGEEYNIPPSSFTIPGFYGNPKYNGFYGKSKDYMRGGANGEVSYITSEDIEKAKNTLRENLFNAAKIELENQIPKMFKLISGGQENKILSFETELKEGDIGQKFVAKMKVLSYAFLYNPKDLSDLIHQIALSKTNNQKDVDINTQKIEFKSTITNLSQGIANLNIVASEIAYGTIDINDLKIRLAGKKEAEVNDVFSTDDNIEKAELSLWPFWVSKVPKSLDKIKIEVIK